MARLSPQLVWQNRVVPFPLCVLTVPPRLFTNFLIQLRGLRRRSIVVLGVWGRASAVDIYLGLQSCGGGHTVPLPFSFPHVIPTNSAIFGALPILHFAKSGHTEDVPRMNCTGGPSLSSLNLIVCPNLLQGGGGGGDRESPARVFLRQY